MTYDSTADTKEHISRVQARIHECTNNLIVRAERHDKSKLMEPEKSGFDQITIRLRDLTYGSDEYKAALADSKATIDHHYHYDTNTHHPEHYKDGIAGMSLLDVIEMLCDWKAAGERTNQGTIQRSLGVNKDRFKIDDQLFAILLNTVKELGW